jgi:hypothetical protein
MMIGSTKTLQEAKKELREGWEKGIECPCCTQLVRLWKHKLNSAIARTLISMYNISKGRNDEWVHIMNEIHITTMYGIAEFWGVIEPKDHQKFEDDKRASGMWRLTEKGKKFVEGKILIPKYLFIFNNKVRRTSEETTSIKGCLGNKFSYSELMDRDFDESKAVVETVQQQTLL